MNTEQNIYKIKIIITLKRLLERAKNLQKELKDNKVIYSYHGVASNALLRKATINDTLNGLTSPKATTLISIIEAMGFTMKDFGDEYDKITEKDIEEFKV